MKCFSFSWKGKQRVWISAIHRSDHAFNDTNYSGDWQYLSGDGNLTMTYLPWAVNQPGDGTGISGAVMTFDTSKASTGEASFYDWVPQDITMPALVLCEEVTPTTPTSSTST